MDQSTLQVNCYTKTNYTMTSSFSVTTASSKILLNAQRHGEIVFTVTNITAQTVIGRADIASDNSTTKAWATIQGETERNFAPNATEQYVVDLNVPGSASIGTYSISLNLIGVDDPDEDFTEGPSVAFEVLEAVVAPPKRKFNFSWWWIVVAVVAFFALEGMVLFSFSKASDNGIARFFARLVSSFVVGSGALLTFGSIVLLKDAILLLVRGSTKAKQGKFPWWWIVAAGLGGLAAGMTTAGIFAADFRRDLGIVLGTLFAAMIILVGILVVTIVVNLILRHIQSLKTGSWENRSWLWVAVSGAGAFVVGAIIALVTGLGESDILYQIVYFGQVLLLPIVAIAGIVVYILLRRRLPIPEAADTVLTDPATSVDPRQTS